MANSIPMVPMQPKVLLIVPCYNEEARLQVHKFMDSNPSIDFIFANDGSTDGTLSVIEKSLSLSGRFQIFTSNINLGKSNIIQLAYQSLKPEQKAKYQWIGYWDADLATPLSELENMLKYAATFYDFQKVKAILGSRVSRLGSRIVRSPRRHYLGRIFVTVASLALRLGPYDSQCGAKIFKPEIADIAFRTPFLSRWIFDLEILLRIGPDGVIESPLMQWQDVPGSKIRIFKVAPRILRDIFRIRKYYLENRF